ncbi:MAG: ATP-binding protein [Bacteroidales bacterium]
MKQISVLSGKGGTGKTSLVAAFATLAQQPVIADCDVDAANLYIVLHPENYKEDVFISGHTAVIDYNTCTHCGLCMTYCRFDAIERRMENGFPKGKITVNEINCDGCRLCARICPKHAITMVPEDKSRWFIGNYRNGKMVHARLAPGEENSGKLVSKVRELAKETAEETGTKLILIDGPPGTGCSAIASLTGTDKVLIVTEPTESGLHDLKRIAELAGKFNVKRYVIINKYDLNHKVTESIKEWCKQENIPVPALIPFAPEIVHAMVQCQSITEWAPESSVSKTITELFHYLTEA